MPDPERLISEDEMAQILADEMANAVETFGSEMLEQIANALDSDTIPDAFSVTNPAVAKWLSEASAGDVKAITETTRDYLRDYLAKAYSDGLGIDDMVDDLTSDSNFAFGDARAENIARTEILGASNFGTYSGLKQSGVISKKGWLATPGTHGSRDGTNGSADHVALQDAGPIGIDEEFVEPVFGDRMQHPGDGPPRQICGCRCAVTAWVDDPEKAATPKGRALHTSHAAIERLREPHEKALKKAAANVLAKQRAKVVEALKGARR